MVCPELAPPDSTPPVAQDLDDPAGPWERLLALIRGPVEKILAGILNQHKETVR